MASIKPEHIRISVIGHSCYSAPYILMPKPTFILYKERWLILLIVSFLQLTCSLVWVTFTPIPNMAAEYLHTSIDNINWIVTASFVAYPIFCLPSMWLMKNYGLKHVIYVSCLTNGVGSLIKMMGSMDFVDVEYRYPITLIGQIIAAIAFPFLMCTPNAVSQLWFPDHQRIYTTTIILTSSNLGTAISSLIAPYIVASPSKLYLINFIFCPLAVVSGLLGVFVRNSSPPTPPSASASLTNRLNRSFISDLFLIFKNKDLMILIICGGGITYGVTSALYSLAQQFTCPYGYTNIFIGSAEFFYIIGGTISAGLLAIVADKTSLFEETVKITFGVGAVLLTGFILVCRIPYQEMVVEIIFILNGCASSAAWALVTELAVETAFPLNEGIIGNFVSLSGNLQTAILVPLMTMLARPLDKLEHQLQTCTTDGHDEVYDLTNSGLFLMGVNALQSIVFILFCNAKYLRRETEKTQSHFRQIVL